MYEMEGPRTVTLHHLPITRPACVAPPATTVDALPQSSGCPALAESEVAPGSASIRK